MVIHVGRKGVGQIVVDSRVALAVAQAVLLQVVVVGLAVEAENEGVLDVKGAGIEGVLIAQAVQIVEEVRCDVRDGVINPGDTLLAQAQEKEGQEGPGTHSSSEKKGMASWCEGCSVGCGGAGDALDRKDATPEKTLRGLRYWAVLVVLWVDGPRTRR